MEETFVETLTTMKQVAQKLIKVLFPTKIGWRRVDVLRRVNVSSVIGDWSYEGTRRCRRPPDTPTLSAIP